MIVFSDVTKTFGEQQTGLQNFSLEIHDGDLIAITGPSGAGKTTLMKLLIREYLPSSGEIYFDEQPLSNLKNSEVAKLRRQIGVVFQDYKLISDMNIWENIALPLYISGQKEAEIESRVTDLLKLVELTDKAYHFPNQLSGGEAQRISIARALATGPKVIFADEPTGNLDKETALRITRLLKKINQLGTTLLLATHNDFVIQELATNKIIYLDRSNHSHNPKKKKLTHDTPAEKKESLSQQPTSFDHSVEAAHPNPTSSPTPETAQTSKKKITFPLLKLPFAKKTTSSVSHADSSTDVSAKVDQDEEKTPL